MTALDKSGDGEGSPAVEWFTIDPSDGSDLAVRPRAIYVGVSGNLKVRTLTGTDCIFVAVPVGYHPIRPVRVLATGTTAGGLLGLY